LEAEVKAEYDAQIEAGVSPLATRVLDFLLTRKGNGWIQEKVLWAALPEPDDAKPSTVRMRRLRALAELEHRKTIVRVTSQKRLKLKQ
jgi:hypothetical protein